MPGEYKNGNICARLFLGWLLWGGFLFSIFGGLGLDLLHFGLESGSVFPRFQHVIGFTFRQAAGRNNKNPLNFVSASGRQIGGIDAAYKEHFTEPGNESLLIDDDQHVD